jgi:very-short-patch-repair endonuclease
MARLYNQADESEKRRSLRSNMPRAEVLVWQQLRKRQVEGYKFRRQYGVDVFVLDFYCPELKLVIEIDGVSHLQGDAPEYDRARQAFLESLGMVVIRFMNRQVYGDLDGVIEAICLKIRELRR